jgi:hypothetical protein
MNSLIKNTDTVLFALSLTLPQQAATFSEKKKGGWGAALSPELACLPKQLVHSGNSVRIS